MPQAHEIKKYNGGDQIIKAMTVATDEASDDSKKIKTLNDQNATMGEIIRRFIII